MIQDPKTRSMGMTLNRNAPPHPIYESFLLPLRPFVILPTRQQLQMSRFLRQTAFRLAHEAGGEFLETLTLAINPDSCKEIAKKDKQKTETERRGRIAVYPETWNTRTLVNLACLISEAFFGATCRGPGLVLALAPLYNTHISTHVPLSFLFFFFFWLGSIELDCGRGISYRFAVAEVGLLFLRRPWAIVSGVEDKCGGWRV